MQIYQDEKGEEEATATHITAIKEVEKNNKLNHRNYEDSSWTEKEIHLTPSPSLCFASSSSS